MEKYKAVEHVCFPSLCTIALKQQWFVLLQQGLLEIANEAAKPWWLKISRSVYWSVGSHALLAMWYTDSQHTSSFQLILATIIQTEIVTTAIWLQWMSPCNIYLPSRSLLSCVYTSLFNFVFLYHVNPVLGHSGVSREEKHRHDLCLIFYEKHSWSYHCSEHIWKWF